MLVWSVPTLLSEVLILARYIMFSGFWKFAEQDLTLCEYMPYIISV